MPAEKRLLRDLVPSGLTELALADGQPAYRGRQLADWLFRHGVLEWDAMSNLPAAWRASLADRFDLAALAPRERQVAADGTRKFLFGLRDGQNVESVIIPMERHLTFCLSTQVGCAMACRFCATARGGLVRNLDAAEICEQVVRLQADVAAAPYPAAGDRQFNVVFMGMGEPLDNWPALRRALDILLDPEGFAMSRRRVQISTSGPGDGLRRLLADAAGVGLTLSLGGSTDEERRKVMPVPGRTPLREALDLAAAYADKTGRRATLAWVLIAGVTDRPEQAARLAALARGRPFKINLIPLNRLDDDDLDRPVAAATAAFRKILTDAGLDAFVRDSGGRDIAAACGQLRRRREKSA